MHTDNNVNLFNLRGQFFVELVAGVAEGNEDPYPQFPFQPLSLFSNALDLVQETDPIPYDSENKLLKS